MGPYLHLPAILQLNILKVRSHTDGLTSAYMQNSNVKCSVRYTGDLRGSSVILQCFGHRAAYLVLRALHLRDVEHRSWNSLLVEFNRMSVGNRPSIPN